MSGRLSLCPISRQTAQEFIRRHHRHHPPQVGEKFAIGALAADIERAAEYLRDHDKLVRGVGGWTYANHRGMTDSEMVDLARNLNHRVQVNLVGVCVVGRPVARGADTGWTLEVTRLATDGTRNACSFLYGAAAKAARAMGYRRIITYTLASEHGSSLRAAGWVEEAHVRGQSWSRPSRPREDVSPTEDKTRWSKTLGPDPVGCPPVLEAEPTKQQALFQAQGGER